MSKVFFTSDTHFGHTNVIKYCNRPFQDVREMDKALIENWNSKVAPDDIVYHLGDFAFYSVDNIFEILKQLNGYIFFVPGNHDKNLLKTIDKYRIELGINIQVLPTLYHETFSVEDERIPFVMCHYAMRVWDKSHYGAIHLYGHSHGTMLDDPNARSMDVGVDTNNMQLYSIDDVLVHMYRKVYKSVDHHE
jgi:calcineurin-like phosphoesterase family protein